MNYLLAHMLEKPPIGVVLPKLPLHMTVVHWFSSEAYARDLSEACRNALSRTSAFVVRVGAEAMFGLNHDVPVNRIVMAPEIRALHNTLLQSLGEVGVRHSNPQWTGDGYNAHVTHKKEGRLHEGDSFVVDSVDLFSAEELEADRTLLTRFQLLELSREE